MFSHKPYLILSHVPPNIADLSSCAIELSDYQLVFNQNMDYKGQPSEAVCVDLNISITQSPNTLL